MLINTFFRGKMRSCPCCYFCRVAFKVYHQENGQHQGGSDLILLQNKCLKCSNTNILCCFHFSLKYCTLKSSMSSFLKILGPVAISLLFCIILTMQCHSTLLAHIRFKIRFTVNNKKTHTDSTKINRPEHSIRMN